MSEQKQTEGGLLARFASPIIILATIIAPPGRKPSLPRRGQPIFI